MLQTDLRGSQDQGLTIVSEHLATEKVEIVCWHCYLSYLEVNILTSQVVINAIKSVIDLRIYILKESFDVASRMLRASTIKTVW